MEISNVLEQFLCNKDKQNCNIISLKENKKEMVLCELVDDIAKDIVNHDAERINLFTAKGETWLVCLLKDNTLLVFLRNNLVLTINNYYSNGYYYFVYYNGDKYYLIKVHNDLMEFKEVSSGTLSLMVLNSDSTDYIFTNNDISEALYECVY